MNMLVTTISTQTNIMASANDAWPFRLIIVAIASTATEPMIRKIGAYRSMVLLGKFASTAASELYAKVCFGPVECAGAAAITGACTAIAGRGLGLGGVGSGARSNSSSSTLPGSLCGQTITAPHLHFALRPASSGF